MTAFDLPTNFSNGTLAVDSIGGMFQYAHYATSGLFAYGALIVIFFIVLATGIAVNLRKSMIAAGFVTTIFAVYFMRIEMISIPITILIALITIISAIVGSREGGSAI